MKKLKIMLLVVLALGLCSAVLAADPQASLARSGLKPYKTGFKGLPQFQEISGAAGHRNPIYSEDFNSTTFPPTGWVRYDLDGGGNQWSRATNQSHSSPSSATHAGGNIIASAQQGLLVSPLLAIPETGLTGFSFWKYTTSPNNMIAGGHLVLITDDPTHNDWYILWEETSPSASWTQTQISLAGLNGIEVYFGFLYECGGLFSSKDTWFIDDVELFTMPSYDLSMDVSPEGSGTTFPVLGTVQAPQNSTLNIAASPGFGYTWDQWNGDVANPALARTTVYMDEDKSLTANFTPYGLDELFVQDGAGSNAYTSVKDGATDYEVAEYFSAPAEEINKLVIHGLAMYHDGTGWVEWTPGASEPFIVRFYEGDANTVPDWNNPTTVPATSKVFSIGPTWSYTGYKVELDLATPVEMSAGWVSVQMNKDAGAGGWFLLLEAENGNDGLHAIRGGDDPGFTEGDTMLELWGTGATGAPTPPVLVYPVDLTNLHKDGFNFRWQMGAGGGMPESYALVLYEDEEHYPDNPFDVWEEIYATQFNPVLDLDHPMSYEYGERWYWAVEAYGDGEASLSQLSSFQIMADPIISQFPWCDGFEPYTDFALEFPPWTLHDGDGTGTWGIEDVDYPNQFYTGSYIIFNPSMTNPPLDTQGWEAHGGNKYAACFAANGSANNDWLISPPISAVEGLKVRFYARSITDMYGLERFKVLVSTTGTDPNSFTQISPGNYIQPPTEWTQYQYPLDYPGEVIYVAIQCVSNDAFVFMVDDFCLFTGDIADFDPPNIKILPVVNTPNPDQHRFVDATIIDESTVAEATLYMSYDDGDSWYYWEMEEDLEATQPDIWWGAIPAGEEMDLEILYFIRAKDVHGNEAETDIYSFVVEDPVWVFYDYGVESYSAIMPSEIAPDTWGVFNFFHNPFYGTGSSLYLYNTEAAIYHPQTNVHMQIYLYTPAEDGEEALQRPYFATPIQVNLTGVDTGADWDIFAFEDFNDGEPIEITDQFFAIAFENLTDTGIEDTNSYFLFNMDHDYGMYGLTISSNPGAWYTFSDAKGMWAISAEIGFGQPGEVPAPGITIVLDEGFPVVNWDAVDSAVSYNVYGSNDPYIPLNEWTRLESGWPHLTYPHLIDEPYKFFYVTASSQSDGNKAQSTAKRETLRLQTQTLGRKTWGQRGRSKSLNLILKNK